MKKLCLLLLTFAHIYGCGKSIEKDDQTENFTSSQEQDSFSITSAENLILHIQNCDYLYLETKLIAENVDPNYITKSGDRLIVLAAKRGITRFIELLVKQGADINLKSSNGESAITVAARMGDSNFVESLLKFNADINSRSKRKETPLLIAIKNNNETLASKLILAGADLSNVDGNNNNATDYSKVLQLNPIVDLISDVKKVNKNNILFPHLINITLAARLYSLEYVLRNYNIESVINGNEYLHKVVQIKDSINRNAIIDLLIKYDVPVNPFEKEGYSALITATINSDETTVKKLLKAGADTNLKDFSQYPPLHYAAINFSYNILELLLKYNADKFYYVNYGTKYYRRNICDNLPTSKRRMSKLKKKRIKIIEDIMDC
jgi:ankyrin repeat protein